MTFDFGRLVENHFKEKRDIFGFDAITELIEEILESRANLTSLMEEVKPPRATFDWTMIPDIPISEIGWSDVTTVEVDGETKTILGPQRELLQQYLNNIGKPDGTFGEQIKSLQNFYSPSGPQEIVAGSEDSVEKIRKLISYLVFYKTLTKVVTNFNASSAGFTFEAFLATLMHGTQIEANTGTIADFYTGDGIPVSLKLYTKLKVEGSWADLVEDIVNPKYSPDFGNAMRYVAVIKSLGGEGLTQSGELDFYQFDITIDNVFDIMLASIHPRVVSLPRRLVDRGEDLAGLMPAREKVPANEELEKQFIKNLEHNISFEGLDGPIRHPGGGGYPPVIAEMDSNFPGPYGDKENGFAERVLQVLEYPREIHKESLFNTWQGLAYTGMKKGNTFYDKILLPLFETMYSAHPDYPVNKAGNLRPAIKKYLKSLGKAFIQAHNDIVKSFESKEIKQARSEILSQVTWVRGTENAEELKKYYDELDLEGKKIALLNTYGIIGSDQRQFGLNDKHATNSEFPTYSENLGTLSIGGAHVEIMIESVRTILDQEIFAVFTSLKVLSDSLNRYFAGGLDDDNAAIEAIGSAKDIQTRTAETRTDDPSQLGLFASKE